MITKDENSGNLEMPTTHKKNSPKVWWILQQENYKLRSLSFGFHGLCLVGLAGVLF